MDKRLWYLIGFLMVILLSACGSQQNSQQRPSQPLISDAVHVEQRPTPTPPIVLPRQVATPTPAPTSQTVPALTPPANIPTTGTGPAPYGLPPALTTEEIQLTQQLFALINHDRAVRGLYPFAWNETLAGGARLHSWNMVHCGFSHTCPDGLNQCTRIANEGFAGLSDCGENIALAGPYPTAWDGVYRVQESMINEPPTGWHRIHLTSTTLHRIGVGVFVDSRGWIWFTEDMVS
ncbi:MAG: CAP domain-containing protein [Ktedonobacteraceae bacterium]